MIRGVPMEESPVSDDFSPTDSDAFRGLAGQPRIQERIAAMSPRSAILSESNVPPEAAERYKPSSQRKRSVDPAPKASVLAQLLETDISRKDPKDEIMRLRELLKTIEQQSLDEAERAKELERTKSEAQKRVELMAATKLAAEQQAIQAQQEVRLVQLQLENAQKEIERGKQAVREVEQQRDDAEASATRAREKARKLHEEMVATQAREEGRRMGFQAGFDYAKAERKIVVAKKKKASQPPREQSRRSQPRTETRQSSSRAETSKPRAPPEPREDIFADDRSIPPRTHTRQSVAPPPRVKPADNVTARSPPGEMSPSQLPLRQLPLDQRSERNTIRPAQSTPLRDFVPPPEMEPERPRDYPRPMSQRPPRQYNKTPSVQIYEIDIPSASEINRQYSNSMENENISPQPREKWVDASTYHEIRGPRRPAPFFLPPKPPQIMFSKLSRPSLQKTKEQATSWYKNFSFRRKNKRVIDPIPEEPTSAGPTTGTFTIQESPPASPPPTLPPSPPASARDEPPRVYSGDLYAVPVTRTAESWYQEKPPSVRPGRTGAPSVRSGFSKRRPDTDAMSVSTRVSQFDLLATPAAPHAAFSMRSGKEGGNGRKVREKDSNLSVIKEDPASRNNTPHRSSGVPQQSAYGRPLSAIPQPDFGQNQKSRRPPPSITVPEHDQELEPFGVAYNRALGPKSDFRYPESGVSRRPSNASQNPPSTSMSINIDVVPPSGIAPPVVNSPPHTGQNHLSPYHVFNPNRPASTAVSHKQSRQSLAPSHIAEPPRNSSALRSPYMYANQSQQPSPSPQPPPQYQHQQQQTPHRPASVLSGASKRPNPPFVAQHHASTSQVSLNSIIPDGGVRGQPPNASASRLVLATPIQRQASNASMRSQGSYSKFNPAGYVDPAFWDPDGPSNGPTGGESYFDPRPANNGRPASVNSGLSYASHNR